MGGFIDPRCAPRRFPCRPRSGADPLRLRPPASLNWSDIIWLRTQTKLPIGVKGVQTAEDAKKAFDAGCDAIYLSNHGARALDGCVPLALPRRRRCPLTPRPALAPPSSSPPALYTLLEINKFYPQLINNKKCEIYLDGGVRRGTDACVPPPLTRPAS